MNEDRFHLCGVPNCNDGVIVQPTTTLTVVECDTHNSRTTWDTVPREEREQEIIRVQDSWSKHGTKSNGPGGWGK